MIDALFQQTPLWLFFPATVTVVLASVAGGHRLGRRVRGKEADETEGPAGTTVGSNFALLAFILAFTFNMTASRFDARKELLLEEINSIGTTYLRTDFLPEPTRSAAQKLLREYVDIRVQGASDIGKLQQAVNDSELIQEELWSQLVELTTQDHDPRLLSLYIQALNDVFDNHAKRVTVGTRHQIPGVIWLALFFVTMLATGAMGYQFGLTEARSNTMVLVLSLSFSAVIMLIADLDRSGEGLLRLNQDPMIELQAKIGQTQFD